MLHLDTALEEVNGAGEVLKEHGVDIKDVAFKLSSGAQVFIEFSLRKRNIITATFNDIAAAGGAACLRLRAELHAEDWLRDREKAGWGGRRGSQPNASTQHGTQ